MAFTHPPLTSHLARDRQKQLIQEANLDRLARKARGTSKASRLLPFVVALIRLAGRVVPLRSRVDDLTRSGATEKEEGDSGAAEAA